MTDQKSHGLTSSSLTNQGVCCCGVAYLWVEEDLRSQETLVAHVNGELLLADGVDAGVLFDPLGAIRVVLVELLHQVGTHVAETLLQGCM